MRVIALDSSSVCTGVVVAELERKKLVKVGSAPVIPNKFDVSELGYRKTKKKFTNTKGKTYSAYTTGDEDFVSEALKKKRDVEVRNAQNSFKMRDIGAQLDNLIRNIQPDLIVIEKNKTFNSILTSTLLAEVMGLVEGLASANNIPLMKLTVEEVRKGINSARLVKEFAATKTAEELASYEDVTKEAIKHHMVSIYGDYGFNPITLDEGDACLIFHHWLNNFNE